MLELFDVLLGTLWSIVSALSSSPALFQDNSPSRSKSDSPFISLLLFSHKLRTNSCLRIVDEKYFSAICPFIGSFHLQSPGNVR